jgi:uncharacterized protein (DUF433 family)
MTQIGGGDHKAPVRIGRFLVADPKVCHGKLTFVGTRVFVKDVLDQVASGLSFDAISAEWNGHVSHEAIREALRLAGQALLDHADDYAQEVASA